MFSSLASQGFHGYQPLHYLPDPTRPHLPHWLRAESLGSWGFSSSVFSWLLWLCCSVNARLFALICLHFIELALLLVSCLLLTRVRDERDYLVFCFCPSISTTSTTTLSVMMVDQWVLPSHSRKSLSAKCYSLNWCKGIWSNPFGKHIENFWRSSKWWLCNLPVVWSLNTHAQGWRVFIETFNTLAFNIDY